MRPAELPAEPGAARTASVSSPDSIPPSSALGTSRATALAKGVFNFEIPQVRKDIRGSVSNAEFDRPLG